MTDAIRKSEFADLLGVSRAYISQLSKAGRLVLTEDGQSVVVKPSLERLAATSNVDKSGVAARHALERAAKGGSAVPVQTAIRDTVAGVESVPMPPPAPQTPAVPNAPQNLATLLFADPMAAYNAARASNEIKRGEQMDIELAKTRRELIGMAGTVKAVADLAMSTRAALERLPDRVSVVIAAEADPAKVYEILQGEITQLCEQIRAAALALPDKLD